MDLPLKICTRRPLVETRKNLKYATVSQQNQQMLSSPNFRFYRIMECTDIHAQVISVLCIITRYFFRFMGTTLNSLCTYLLLITCLHTKYHVSSFFVKKVSIIFSKRGGGAFTSHHFKCSPFSRKKWERYVSPSHFPPFESSSRIF